MLRGDLRSNTGSIQSPIRPHQRPPCLRPQELMSAGVGWLARRRIATVDVVQSDFDGMPRRSARLSPAFDTFLAR